MSRRIIIGVIIGVIMLGIRILANAAGVWDW